MKRIKPTLFAAAILSAVVSPSYANDVFPELQEPAKSLPAPTTSDISPEMQKFIAAPLNPDWNALWKTGDEARAYALKQAAGVLKNIEEMKQRLQVSVEPKTINGVKVYVITPAVVPPENRDKVLIHVHGGCYVLFPGEAGTPRGVDDGGHWALQGRYR